MTLIESIEWAVAQLHHQDGDPHLDALKEHLGQLHFNHRQWNTGKGSLAHFMKKHHILIPQKEFDGWRMLDPGDQRMGEITGLPESRGVVRCTNGILCYIERSGAPPFLGHLQWFIPDERPQMVQLGRKAKGGKVKKKNLEDLILEEILA